MQKPNDLITEFLSESNAIEGVYDEDSYSQAEYAWQYLMSQKELTIDVVLKTHKILMLHQKLQPDQKGYFRTVPVWVGGREGMRADKISENMKDWCEMMNDSMYLPWWDSLHVLYEIIHPFVDGNGRTGRMFMNWYRLKFGLPLLIIHTGKEQQEYYTWFKGRELESLIPPKKNMAKKKLEVEEGGVYTVKRGVFPTDYFDGVPAYVRLHDIDSDDQEEIVIGYGEILDETGYSLGVQINIDVEDLGVQIVQFPKVAYAIQYMKDEDPVETFATRETMEKRLKQVWLDSDVERDSIRVFEIKRQISIAPKGRGVMLGK